MEYKILESNGIDIENVDGAAFNNFSAGGKNGVLKGVLSECNLTSSGSTLFIQPGELLIQGFRVKILSPHSFSLGSSASLLTQVLTARISLRKDRSVSFNLFVSSQGPVYKDDLFSEEEGVYDIELARIVTDQNGIVSVKKTFETLSGNSGTGSSNGETDSVLSPVLLGLTRHDGLIQNNGAILKLFDYAYVTIPVKGGQQLSIQSGNNGAVFSCHTSVSAESASYSQGSGWTTKVTLGANMAKEYTLPEDAKYLVFYTLYANIESYPVSLSIDGFDFCKGLADNVSQKFSKSDVVQESGTNPKKVMSQEATTKSINASVTQPLIKTSPKNIGYIRSTGAWHVVDGYEHIVIPVEGGQKLSITTGAKTLYFACVTDYTKPVDYEALPFSQVEGWTSRREIYANKSKEYTVPEDAKYLVVQTLFASEETYPNVLSVDEFDYCLSVIENTKNAFKHPSVSDEEATVNLDNYGTIYNLPLHKGYIDSQGKWVVLDGYEYCLVPVSAGSEVTVVVADTGSTYFAFLTSYSVAEHGVAAPLSSIEPYNKNFYISSGALRNIIAPEDAQYLFVGVKYNNVNYYPKSLVVDGYDYYKNIEVKVKELAKSTNDLQSSVEELSNLDIFNPIKHDTVWENGGYNNTTGSPLSNFNHKARKRTGYLSFDTRVNIVSDRAYLVTLSICDENLNLVRSIPYNDSYSGDFLCVPPNTTFRLLIQDATDATKDISAVTSKEINEHISVYRNGTSYFTNPKVRWYAMGDSITQGYVSTGAISPSNPIPAKGWAHKVADMKNWIITNRGVGGSGWIQGGTSTPKPSWTVAASTDFTQFDLVTLAYGINDWNAGVPIGSIEAYDPSATPTTVISSMCKTLDTIIASNPLCKIFVITPLNCWWKGDESTNWAVGAQNASGITLGQFVAKVKEVCDYYGIEVIDMTHSSVVNRKNIQSCMLDRVHPTEAAHTAIAHELAAKIAFE